MLRRQIILLFFSFLIFSSLCKSQHIALKLNPFGYIQKNWNWNPQQYSIEGSWNNKFSIVLYFETGLMREYNEYEGNNSNGTPSYQYAITKVYVKGFIPEFRYYLSQKKVAPFGFFTGVYFHYRQLKEVYHGHNYAYYPDQLLKPEIDLTNYKNYYSIGLSTGYKIALRYLFAEFLFGIGYLNTAWKDDSERYKMNPNGKIIDDDPSISGRLEIAIGIVIPPTPKKKAKQIN